MTINMSIRIMYDVRYIANKYGIEMIIKDRYIIHLKMDCIKKLEEEYLNKYKRILIGKGPGQFHSLKCLGTKIDENLFTKISLNSFIR
jgi:hypothetical protein